MIFPFKIVYRAKIESKLQSPDQILLEIKDFLTKESADITDIEIENDKVSFGKIFSKSFTITLDKGIVVLENEGPVYLIKYTIIIFWLLFFMITVPFIIAVLRDELLFGWHKAILIVCLLFWIGTIISHKLMFNRMIKIIRSL